MGWFLTLAPNDTGREVTKTVSLIPPVNRCQEPTLAGVTMSDAEDPGMNKTDVTSALSKMLFCLKR